MEDEPRRLRAGDEKRPEEKERRQYATHLYYKHYRVAYLVYRIEFNQRIDERAPDNPQIKKGALFLLMIHEYASCLLMQHQVFGYRSQPKGGEERQCADYYDHACQKQDKERRMRRQCACSRRHIFFCRQRAGYGKHRYHGPEPSEKHGYTTQGVVERRIGIETAKGATIIV